MSIFEALVPGELQLSGGQIEAKHRDVIRILAASKVSQNEPKVIIFILNITKTSSLEWKD